MRVGEVYMREGDRDRETERERERERENEKERERVVGAVYVLTPSWGRAFVRAYVFIFQC